MQKIDEKYFYEKAHGLKFKRITSMERLGCELRVCEEAMVRISEKVILSKQNYKGENIAAIYEFIETPEDDVLDLIECRLSLIGISEETFLDSGSAIAWGLARI